MQGLLRHLYAGNVDGLGQFGISDAMSSANFSGPSAAGSMPAL
jgi:hypothetical protein